MRGRCEENCYLFAQCIFNYAMSMAFINGIFLMCIPNCFQFDLQLLQSLHDVLRKLQSREEAKESRTAKIHPESLEEQNIHHAQHCTAQTNSTIQQYSRVQQYTVQYNTTVLHGSSTTKYRGNALKIMHFLKLCTV